MIKYDSNIIYTGDIMEKNDGEDVLIRKDAPLIYDKDSDEFYIFDAIYPYIMGLYLEPYKLTSADKAEHERIIEDNKLSYGKEVDVGEKYVKAESIREFIVPQKKKGNRR